MNLKAFVFTFLFTFVFTFAILVYYRSDNTRSLIVPTIQRWPTEEKVVSLTFDDGPSAIKTKALLDLFEQESIVANFFIMGENVEKNKDLAERMVDEGHLLANHSYSHKRLILQTPQTVEAEVQKTEDILRNIGVKSNHFFRPPYQDEMLILPLILQQKGKFIVSADVDPQLQYKKEFDPQALAQEAIAATRPGSIIILHDGNDDNVENLIEAVRNIIIGLKQQGYKFVRLDDLQ